MKIGLEGLNVLMLFTTPIISRFQPSELPCGKYDKIALISITKAGLYINGIMEVSIISCLFLKTGSLDNAIREFSLA